VCAPRRQWHNLEVVPRPCLVRRHSFSHTTTEHAEILAYLARVDESTADGCDAAPRQQKRPRWADVAVSEANEEPCAMCDVMTPPLEHRECLEERLPTSDVVTNAVAPRKRVEEAPLVEQFPTCDMLMPISAYRANLTEAEPTPQPLQYQAWMPLLVVPQPPQGEVWHEVDIKAGAAFCSRCQPSSWMSTDTANPARAVCPFATEHSALSSVRIPSGTIADAQLGYHANVLQDAAPPRERISLGDCIGLYDETQSTVKDSNAFRRDLDQSTSQRMSSSKAWSTQQDAALVEQEWPELPSAAQKLWPTPCVDERRRCLGSWVHREFLRPVPPEKLAKPLKCPLARKPNPAQRCRAPSSTPSRAPVPPPCSAPAP